MYIFFGVSNRNVPDIVYSNSDADMVVNGEPTKAFVRNKNIC